MTALVKRASLPFMANNIEMLREQAKLSRAGVADRLGVDGNTVRRWESGVARPTWENATELADLFDVSIDFLLGRTERPPREAA